MIQKRPNNYFCLKVDKPALISEACSVEPYSPPPSTSSQPSTPSPPSAPSTPTPPSLNSSNVENFVSELDTEDIKKTDAVVTWMTENKGTLSANFEKQF